MHILSGYILIDQLQIYKSIKVISVICKVALQQWKIKCLSPHFRLCLHCLSLFVPVFLFLSVYLHVPVCHCLPMFFCVCVVCLSVPASNPVYTYLCMPLFICHCMCLYPSVSASVSLHYCLLVHIHNPTSVIPLPLSICQYLLSLPLCLTDSLSACLHPSLCQCHLCNCSCLCKYLCLSLYICVCQTDFLPLFLFFIPFKVISLYRKCMLQFTDWVSKIKLEMAWISAYLSL